MKFFIYNLESLFCHSGQRAGIQSFSLDPRVKPEDDKVSQIKNPNHF